jgi:hypothetical protein
MGEGMAIGFDGMKRAQIIGTVWQGFWELFLILN